MAAVWLKTVIQGTMNGKVQVALESQSNLPVWSEIHLLLIEQHLRRISVPEPDIANNLRLTHFRRSLSPFFKEKAH
jgi:hypothetical protein